MPKNTFIPKPRLEKLPLAVRKDLRDNFETKKADWESEIAGQLGFPLSINFDAQAIWPYAEENGATGAGTIFAGYIDGFMYALKSYIENFGNLGREYFKHAVTNNELSLIPNEKGDDAEAITADVKDGVFRIVFHYKRLGYNQSWLNDPFIKAIDQAPHEGFSLTAKHSIEAHYNEEIEDVHEAIAKILNLPDVKLDPSFDENYAKLLKKDDQSWQSNFGKATLEYFRDGVKYQLERDGFNNDEMLQEGFAEGVPSKTIKLRVVDKTKGGSSYETILEDGVIYVQTLPDRWWCNVSEAGSNIVGLL